MRSTTGLQTTTQYHECVVPCASSMKDKYKVTHHERSCSCSSGHHKYIIIEECVSSHVTSVYHEYERHGVQEYKREERQGRRGQPKRGHPIPVTRGGSGSDI